MGWSKFLLVSRIFTSSCWQVLGLHLRLWLVGFDSKQISSPSSLCLAAHLLLFLSLDCLAPSIVLEVSSVIRLEPNSIGNLVSFMNSLRICFRNVLKYPFALFLPSSATLVAIVHLFKYPNQSLHHYSFSHLEELFFYWNQKVFSTECSTLMLHLNSSY